MITILGTPKGGKSAFAEELFLKTPGIHLYLATMIPIGKVGRSRVLYHQRMREGKDFVTVEAPTNVYIAAAEKAITLLPEGILGCSCLVECMSNWLAKELFSYHKTKEEAIHRILAQLEQLDLKAMEVILVTNTFALEERMDEETRMYVKAMDELNEKLVERSKGTYRKEEGEWKFYAHMDSGSGSGHGTVF